MMQSQRRRFFPSRFDEIKDFEDGRKALLLATIPLVDKRDDDDDEEHPRVWQGRRVSKTPIIIYICVREKSYPPKRRGKSDEKQKIFLFKERRKSTPFSRVFHARERRNDKTKRTTLSNATRLSLE